MGQLLYHYCSTPTAFAILQSRTIRLSALSAANDSREGRVLGDAFARALERTSLSTGVKQVASLIVQGYPDSTEGFAFCLSEDGDLLSQWRAYAHDGTGMSIGFDADALREDFGAVKFGGRYFELSKVIYGDVALAKELDEMATTIQTEFGHLGEFVRLNDGTTPQEALRKLANRAEDVRGLFQGNADSQATLDKLLKALGPLHFRIYGIKPKSFEEEREWRILRFQHHAVSPDLKFVADDGRLRRIFRALLRTRLRWRCERSSSDQSMARTPTG